MPTTVATAPEAVKAAPTTAAAAGASASPPPAASAALKKKIIVFEVRGGTDKGPDGHRKDTMPIVRALEKQGWRAEVVFYSDAEREAVQRKALEEADAFMMRVNPGVYEGFTDSKFMDMGRELHNAGCTALQHPDVMLWDCKDSLVKLRALPCGLPDTYVYYELDKLKQQVPESLAQTDRVLKQNRGSTGEGIWVIKPHGWERGPDLKRVSDDTLISATEMVDNSHHVVKLGEFMERCNEYIEGENGLVVDQRFLPRIVEGEVRVLMIGDASVQIVHKRPAEGQMSATLFSGARYTYDAATDPKWTSLLKLWMADLPQVRDILGPGLEYPLIWTADFILDTNPDGTDAYRLGELNASCIGFSTHLELADTIARRAISTVLSAKGLAASPASASDDIPHAKDSADKPAAAKRASAGGAADAKGSKKAKA